MTVHALRRAKERYNLELEFEDLHKIMAIIKAGNAKFLYKATYDKFFFALTYQNIPIKVLYQNNFMQRRQRIITFYPLDVEEYNALQA